MNFDFVVLGASGEEGSIAARDLLNSGYSVLLCGRNLDRIKPLLKKYKNAKFEYVNVRDIKKTVSVIKNSGSKIILNCVELRLNMEVMQACIEANVNYLDLGGLQEMTIQQYKLDNEFRKRKLTALLGCGSTPGIVNVMARYSVDQMDSVYHIDLGFGWDSNIKEFVLPYSIESIIYELTTIPIVLEGGKFEKSRICTMEKIDKLKGVGKQITHCIVHSEVYTFTKYFRNKGLGRVHYAAGFPEHSYKVLKLLIDLGFGSKDTIIVNNNEVKIIDYTREVLKIAKHPRNYKETENVWVKVIGEKAGKAKTITMNCLTKTLKGFEDVGSNINTGMTLSIMSQLLFRGEVSELGITAPEACVPSHSFFKELAKRKIIIYKDGKRMN